jgi:protease-4
MKKLVTGLNLSWNRFLLGGEAPVAGEQILTQGSLQTFASLREMRSMTPRRKHLVFYDMAGIITDTPRLYAGIQDLMPDGTGSRSLFEFIADMERLENSPQVESVIFMNQEFITSFSNIIEIEQALLRLKEAGKQIYFYADRMSSTQYALAASTADEIYMTPRGSLDLTGFGVTKLYFKDLLAKYGVDIVNFRSHEYKTAYDGLSESGMTDVERESLETVYGALQDEMDRMVLARETKLTEGLDGLYAEGFWMPAYRADETGLIDQVMYRDELEDWIDTRGYYVVRYSRLRWDADYEWNPANRSSIALIYANGPVFEGEGIRGRSIGAESLASAIRSARINPLVQSIVLRINSGGGSALASDLIAREVALCSLGDNPKPIVISMAGSAASGGYMIAAPGSHILATPATLTGSIGVIAVVPNLAGLLEYFEVGSDTVTTKESADAPNVFRPLTEAEESLIRNSIMDEYDAFVTLVAENREMTVDEVDAAARGRIWTGKQAVERGLVDDIGGLDDAIELAEELAGIRDARVLEIDPGNIGFNFPGMPGAAAALLGLQTPDPLSAVPTDFRDVVEFYKTLSEFERGEALYYMPYSLEELGLEERPD